MRSSLGSRCPVLVIHGDRRRDPLGASAARRVPTLTGGASGAPRGLGHCPQARDPVKVNLLVREFVQRRRPPTSAWTRAMARRRRALYISSPIGLGHAQRDVAIARELRSCTRTWRSTGSRRIRSRGCSRLRASASIRPARELASESQHIESESAEHDLHCFQAMAADGRDPAHNFMVFHDVVAAERYDLWIGDEAWDVDYYLHENPELKRAAYCWLTDFVGWLPMPDGGEREAFLTADYNAEMVEHIARYPAPARPGDLRRQPRRHRPRPASAPSCP